MSRRITPSAGTHEEAAIRVTPIGVVVTAWRPERTALVLRLRLFSSAVPRVVADGMDRMAGTVTAGLEIDDSRRAEAWLNSTEIIEFFPFSGTVADFQQLYLVGVQEKCSPTCSSRTWRMSRRDPKWPADV